MSSSTAAEIKCGVYDVSLPARAIAPLHDLSGDRQSYFLVGSCAAPDGTAATRNKISLLSYGEEKTFVNCVGILGHDAGEVLQLATPGNAVTTDDIGGSGGGAAAAAGLFSTVHTLSNSANPSAVGATVHRVKRSGASDCAIETVCALPAGTSAVAWHPLKMDSPELRVVLGAGEVGVVADYTRGGGSAENGSAVTARYQLPGVAAASSSPRLVTDLMTPTVISWDPIYGDRIVAARGTSLYQIDTRSKTGASSSSSGGGAATASSTGGSASAASLLCGTAHGFGAIRSIHSNRNELNLVVTAGDDGAICFWDLRKASGGPLLSHRVHDHWVQKVIFNRMSDKTLLTCSSDRSAKVWQLGQSVPWGASSSAVAGGAEGGGVPTAAGAGGGRARSGSMQRSGGGAAGGGSGLSGSSLGEFGEAVMDCCWSAITPFVTAAVSYNGKVVIGTVSKTTRDGIYGL